MLSKKALVLAAGALAGCTVPVATSSHPAEPTAPLDAQQAVAQVDQNLARLQALDVFQVGQLVVEQPASASSCYGPCPGADAAIAAAKAKAAVRLAELADKAESAVVTPVPGACDQTSIDANLAALSALHIVGVDGMVVTQPQNNPQCYNTPCPADVAAAKAANCERDGKLAAIVAAAKGL
jgi:hypothetical protein